MNKPSPPIWSKKILQWYCKDSLYESIMGDLEEQFDEDVEKSGKTKAKWKFSWNVVRFCRSGVVKSLGGSGRLNNYGMLKNFIKISFRVLWKQKTYTAINVFGLAIGSAILLVLLNYTFYEYSYDRFHHNTQDIYRVTMDEFDGKNLLNEYAITFPAVGPAISKEYSDVEDYVRMYTESTYGPVIFTHEENSGDIINHLEPKSYYVDNSFFKIFNFEFLKGNPEVALAELNSVVITERASEKFFQEKNPMGKELTVYDRGGSKNLIVSGVVKNPPVNSHIQFDFLISYPSLCADEWCNTSWDFNDFTTYIRLSPGTSPETIELRFESLLKKHKASQSDEDQVIVELNLQPLDQIHLYSNRIQELSINGDGNHVRNLLICAFLVVIISWMNYVLLSTALSSERVREVGIRKILGSSKKQLIIQFIGESAMINFCAIFIAVLVSELIMGTVLESVFNVSINSFLLDFNSFYGLTYNLVIIVMFLLGVILAGTYPAFVLSSNKPLNALKGKIMSIKGRSFRSVLVTTQFTITFILCSFLFAVFQQINYMESGDLGFNKQNIVVIEAPRIIDKNTKHTKSASIFREEILKSSYIQSMTASTLIPGKPHNWGLDIKRLNYNSAKDLPAYLYGVDYDFIDSYQMQLSSGRGFSKTHKNDKYHSVILNEAAVKSLNYESATHAIGQDILMFGGDKREIIGVVSDFKQESLKKSPVPYALFLYEGQGFYSLKISETNSKQAIADMARSWELVYPNNPLNFFFLDDFYNEQYKGDNKFFTVFSISSVLLLIIAFIGLFGLMAFNTNKNLKEISVRKVFGASIISIWISLYKSLFILIVVSMLAAIPVSYYFISLWLESYPFRIDIQPLFFILPSIFIWTISLVVVGIYSNKISIVNPAYLLRDE